jgi:putative N6-adenine-specific DNA methylase
VSLQNIFFLTFPVDLEVFGEEELALKWPLFFPESSYKVHSRVMGGIEIECSIDAGFQLNHILKCPSRILLRLTSFKCRDVPKLFQRTSKFNWSPYLLSTAPKVHIAATESRLFDSRKIEKAFHDGVAEFFRHQPMKKKYQELNSSLDSAPEIFIRFENDTCTFSLDTTGELLHKRGEKLLTGLAPIRESLASLLLMAMGATPEATLIDPMCGSGTFLIEAHDFFKANNAREFSYKNTPIYIEQKSHMHLAEVLEQKLFSSFLGFDNNKDIISEAGFNKGTRNIVFNTKDVLEDEIHESKKNVVILNPPYGKRVGNKSEIDIKYYLNILRAIQKNYSPIKIGIIIPQEHALRSTKELNILKAIPFKNGGIAVVFYILDDGVN